MPGPTVPKSLVTIYNPGKFPLPTTQQAPPSNPPQSLAGAEYSFSAEVHTQSKNVIVDQLCNSVTVINKGTMVARVNGVPVNPPIAAGLSGESFTIGGNYGELFAGQLQIVVDPADASPAVVVIQKFYLP